MHPGWKQTLFKSSLFILTQSLHFWGSRIKKIILKGPRYEFEQSVKQSQNFGLSLQFMEMLISFFMQLEWDMAKHRNTLSVLCVEAKGSPSAGNCRAEGIISLFVFHLWLEIHPLKYCHGFQQARSFRFAISEAIKKYWVDITRFTCLFPSFIFLFADQRTLETILWNCHYYRLRREINDPVDGFKNSEGLSRCFPQNIIPSPTYIHYLAQTPSSFGTHNPDTEKTDFFFFKFHITYHSNVQLFTQIHNCIQYSSS